MTLTAIVGALMALVASPKRLERSQARLVDRIERLERELALAQAVLEHWRDEAARLARVSRDYRADRDRWRDFANRAPQQAQQAMLQAQAQQGQQLALAQGQQAQGQQLAYNGLPPGAGAMQQMQTFEGFCNCVPSRAQVWGAQHGLVQKLNDNGR